MTMVCIGTDEAPPPDPRMLVIMDAETRLERRLRDLANSYRLGHIGLPEYQTKARQILRRLVIDVLLAVSNEREKAGGFLA